MAQWAKKNLLNVGLIVLLVQPVWSYFLVMQTLFSLKWIKSPSKNTLEENSLIYFHITNYSLLYSWRPHLSLTSKQDKPKSTSLHWNYMWSLSCQVHSCEATTAGEGSDSVNSAWMKEDFPAGKTSVYTVHVVVFHLFTSPPASVSGGPCPWAWQVRLRRHRLSVLSALLKCVNEGERKGFKPRNK